MSHGKLTDPILLSEDPAFTTSKYFIDKFRIAELKELINLPIDFDAFR